MKWEAVITEYESNEFVIYGEDFDHLIRQIRSQELRDISNIQIYQIGQRGD